MSKFAFEPHSLHGETIDGEAMPFGYISQIQESGHRLPVFELNTVFGDMLGLDLAGIARAMAEAPAMVEALRRILQWIDAGCDPSRKSLENARAILSRIEGAGPPLSAYAETVTDAEYREIANGRASWPLKGASGDGAGDTLPDAPVPAPTGEVVTVRADHLAALVEAAGKYADDLETGLEDGTYEDRADLDAVKAAIAAVQGEA